MNWFPKSFPMKFWRYTRRFKILKLNNSFHAKLQYLVLSCVQFLLNPVFMWQAIATYFDMTCIVQFLKSSISKSWRYIPRFWSQNPYISLVRKFLYLGNSCRMIYETLWYLRTYGCYFFNMIYTYWVLRNFPIKFCRYIT